MPEVVYSPQYQSLQNLGNGVGRLENFYNQIANRQLAKQQFEAQMAQQAPLIAAQTGQIQGQTAFTAGPQTEQTRAQAHNIYSEADARDIAAYHQGLLTADQLLTNKQARDEQAQKFSTDPAIVARRMALGMSSMGQGGNPLPALPPGQQAPLAPPSAGQSPTTPPALTKNNAGIGFGMNDIANNFGAGPTGVPNSESKTSFATTTPSQPGMSPAGGNNGGTTPNTLPTGSDNGGGFGGSVKKPVVPLTPQSPPAGVPVVGEGVEGKVPGSESYNGPAPSSGNPPALPPPQVGQAPLVPPNGTGTIQTPGNPIVPGVNAGSVPVPTPAGVNGLAGIAQNVPANPSTQPMLPPHLSQLSPEDQQRFIASQPPGYTPLEYAQTYESQYAAQHLNPLNPPDSPQIREKYAQLGLNPDNYVNQNGTFNEGAALRDYGQYIQKIRSSVGGGLPPGKEYAVGPDGKLTMTDMPPGLIKGLSGLPKEAQDQVNQIATEFRKAPEYKDFLTATGALQTLDKSVENMEKEGKTSQKAATVLSSIAKLDNPGGVLRLSIVDLMKEDPGLAEHIKIEGDKLIGQGELSDKQVKEIQGAAHTYFQSDQTQFAKTYKDSLLSAQAVTGGQVPIENLARMISGVVGAQAVGVPEQNTNTESNEKTPPQQNQGFSMIKSSPSTGLKYGSKDGGKTWQVIQ